MRESTQLEPIVSGPEVVGTERMWHLGSKIGVDAADAVAEQDGGWGREDVERDIMPGAQLHGPRV